MKMLLTLAMRCLQNWGGYSNSKPILVFIDKGAKCLASLLGVLYSGNSYVPMDVKTPVDRMKSIVGTIGDTPIVITTMQYKEVLKGFNIPIEVFEYDELACLGNLVNKEEKSRILDKIRTSIVDTDLMYVLFTSGSTGIPKGVAITHRSVIDYVDAFINSVGMTENDIVGNQAPFYVDMSLRDLYVTLAVGATLCVIPAKYFMTPKKVLQYLDDNNVTYIMWVPTAYRIIFQFKALDKVRPSSLRKFIFSGESMPTPVYCYWKNYYKKEDFYQLYGPTEITGACTFYKVNREFASDETIPIGKAFENTGILLVSEDGRIIKNIDTEGEICVYGSCLAGGYYHDMDKTNDKFVQRPDVDAYPSLMYKTGDLGVWDKDGNLIFKSRKDFQIKHVGRRIELGEIEAAIQTVDGVDACCCAHNRKKDAIILFYSGTTPEDVLRNRIKSKLPKYMIPDKTVKYDLLPQLASGKLDRKKLDLVANEGELNL